VRRVPLRASALFLAAAALLAPAAARAAEPSPTLLDHLSAGRDLLRTAPTIALFDGAWSVVTELDTLLTSRRWDAPYPEGLVAQVATRALYGTSWTGMLVLESFAASLASGGRFDWLAEAHYRTDWLFGVTAPACSTPGGSGGCGAGVGSFGGLHVRPRGSRWWFEVTGGWLEQRIANDAQRTLEESSWVLTPLAVTYALEGNAGPVRASARLGPGAYFGMHAAHLHPTTLGAKTLDVPWHELYPLDVGIGPGARGELALTFARRVRLAGGVVMAPLVAGTRHTRSSPELAPLDAGGSGLPWWRALSLGLDVTAPPLGMQFGASLFFAELSTRRLDEFGHAGFMFRFDFPLRAPRSEPGAR
jgi:hypothetical protein